MLSDAEIIFEESGCDVDIFLEGEWCRNIFWKESDVEIFFRRCRVATFGGWVATFGGKSPLLGGIFLRERKREREREREREK